MKNIVRLFTHTQTGYLGFFEDNDIGFWVVAAKVEKGRLYLMITDGIDTWLPHGPKHSDINFEEDSPGASDNEGAILELNVRGWTCYAFINDSEMYNAADFTRDLYQNAVKL